ncbi:MAG: LutC/YkgG family protein [Dysgonomonas sp.]
MSTKEEILNMVKRQIRTSYDMPDFDINTTRYDDKIKTFTETVKSVGGNAVELKDGENINDIIKSLYPNVGKITSNLEEITIATFNPDEASDPHELENIDLSVVEGQIGVAENGCVWIPQNVRHKVIYFICEYLVIVLDKNKIVNNMHEAYENLTFSDKGFGAFISGPSKTADIEQSLVMGAHGAKGVTVIIR